MRRHGAGRFYPNLIPELGDVLERAPQRPEAERIADNERMNDERAFLTTIHARNFLDDDLDQQERLDARIARLIRELIEIKANKQALRRAQ